MSKALVIAVHVVGFLVACAVLGFSVTYLDKMAGWTDTARQMISFFAGMPVGLATLYSYLTWEDRHARY